MNNNLSLMVPRLSLFFDSLRTTLKTDGATIIFHKYCVCTSTPSCACRTSYCEPVGKVQLVVIANQCLQKLLMVYVNCYMYIITSSSIHTVTDLQNVID